MDDRSLVRMRMFPRLRVRKRKTPRMVPWKSQQSWTKIWIRMKFSQKIYQEKTVKENNKKMWRRCPRRKREQKILALHSQKDLRGQLVRRYRRYRRPRRQQCARIAVKLKKTA